MTSRRLRDRMPVVSTGAMSWLCSRRMGARHALRAALSRGLDNEARAKSISSRKALCPIRRSTAATVSAVTTNAIVVESLTKFMGGHGTTLGGIIVDGGKFPWAEHGRRFAMMNEPEKSYHGLVFTERYGPAAYIARCRAVSLRNTGSILAPLNAFLLLQGIETVALRIERHVENAEKVAGFLRNDRRVGWVNYAGFQDSPYHALTQKYLGGRACSLLTFGVAGGFEAGKRFYDALKLFKRLVNIGDAKSLACHPASTTHRQMSPEEQKKAGVRPEMIRLSVGIEHVDDIIADLDQALHAAD